MSDALPNIFPALRYEDAPAAIAFLRDAFGFEEAMVVPGPDDTISHAELRLGAGMVMLGSKGTGEADRLHYESGATGIYVCVDNVDSHHDRAAAAGAEIVRGLANTDYGSREYTTKDPEGNHWSFGTYQPLAGGGSAG